MNAGSSRSARRSPRRASPRTTAGIILLCAGLAVSAWLGWEYWGTTWLAHRAQASVMSSIQDSWKRGKDSALVPEGHRGGPVAAEAIVRIPRFGAHFAVPVLEGTSDSVLAAGLGHYLGSAPPGGLGNYALAGHRVTHGQPLHDMPELRPGDRVLVETRESVFTYVLDTGGGALVVPFTAGWVLDPAPRNPDGGLEPPRGAAGRRLITLTTCSELFHTDNRYVAFGHLESTRPRS